MMVFNYFVIKIMLETKGSLEELGKKNKWEQMNKIVCFGEVLWDVFPNNKIIGGAPFNVAYRLNSLEGSFNN